MPEIRRLQKSVRIAMKQVDISLNLSDGSNAETRYARSSSRTGSQKPNPWLLDETRDQSDLHDRRSLDLVHVDRGAGDVTVLLELHVLRDALVVDGREPLHDCLTADLRAELFHH